MDDENEVEAMGPQDGRAGAAAPRGATVIDFLQRRAERLERWAAEDAAGSRAPDDVVTPVDDPPAIPGVDEPLPPERREPCAVLCPHCGGLLSDATWAGRPRWGQVIELW